MRTSPSYPSLPPPRTNADAHVRIHTHSHTSTWLGTEDPGKEERKKRSSTPRGAAVHRPEHHHGLEDLYGETLELKTQRLKHNLKMVSQGKNTLENS